MARALTRDEAATLCSAGALAPSGGNDQPWRVIVSGNRLRIDTHPVRGARSFLDVGGYASLMAIGSFAENVAIAAPSCGRRCEVTVDGGAVDISVDDGELYRHPQHDYVEQRVTNRRSTVRQVEQSTVDLLGSVLADSGFQLSTVSSGADNDRVIEALAMADVVRMRHPVMFDDMMREIRWSAAEVESGEGIDIATLELPASARLAMRTLRRARWLHQMIPASVLTGMARDLVRSCSHICCISTEAALTPDLLIRAGMAIQRLWLTATEFGVAVQPWTVSTMQVVRLEQFGGDGFTPTARHRVAQIGRGLRAGFDLQESQKPLFVLRMSVADTPTVRARRLPWDTFTTFC